MFSKEKAIGIPKFLVLPLEDELKGKSAINFKKNIAENNF